MIGAGIGGLSAAIALAAAGERVRVLERTALPGGKVGVRVLEGVEVDTGPSLLTLPGTLDDLFRLAGTSLSDQLSLRSHEPAFRYLFADGTRLYTFASTEATLASVRETLGAAAESELASFLAYARRIWEAAAPRFVFGPAPEATLAELSGSGIPDLFRIDALRTMRGAIRSRVRSAPLSKVLLRFATYNGSDPRRAPATLNCISWVELGLGGWGVEGGMYEIVRALVRVAESLGVELEYATDVEDIVLGGEGDVRGVRSRDGREWPTRTVVGNAEAAHVLGELLPPHARQAQEGEPSMSAWTGIVRARRPAAEGAEPRAAHTVLFPGDYQAEFASIFDARRSPAAPAAYVCAQEACHGRIGWPEDEPCFVMANAPAAEASPDSWEKLGERALARLTAAGMLAAGDRLLWSRTPADLAADFPGSGGALYGAASNGPWAAFRRPPNRVRAVPGLYLASGSAHPGGGVPLCVLSGRAAAAAALEDLGVSAPGR